ncbi:MAG: FHA domain-containing protein [Myxococcota bacterium]
MTSKVVLKLAEDVLDRGFRDAEGEVDRKIDLSFLLDDMGSSFEKAEPALEYLLSRGLIRPYTGDTMYLSELGVKAISEETDIKVLPKYQREWPQQQAAASSAPAVEEPAGLRRPYRPLVSFVGADGERVDYELGWVTVIGRSDEADFTLPDPRASKKHVELKYAGDRYVLKDLGSANGTMVNGNYVDVHPLAHGDVVLVGRTELTYSCPEVILEPPGEPPEAALPPAPPKMPPVEAPTVRPEAQTQRPDPAPPRPQASQHPRPEASSNPQRPELRGEVTRSGPARAEPKKLPTPEAPARRSQPTPTPVLTPAPASDPVRIVKGRPEAAPKAQGAEAGGDLFAEPRAAPQDLFAEDVKTEAGQGNDLFAAPPADELFEEDTPKRGTQKPKGDLFAPAEDRPQDLFAADYAASVPRDGPSLFDDARPDDLFGETVIKPKHGGAPVSPLPLGAHAKPDEDILPEIPIDDVVPELPLEPIEPLDADPVTLSDVSDAATAALMNPLDQKPSGRTEELPVWGPKGPIKDGSLEPYGSPAPFEERTPVERSGSTPAALLAEARDLPEAPETLDDSGSSLPSPAATVGEPVPYQAFLETLYVLRGRISDAGIPDQGRVLEAIDLLKKHPSVRAALTE